METSLKRQEGDMCALSVWFKEAQSKDLDTRCKEMESGLENERQARARDNQYEADELQERFDQHTLATQTQLESGQTQLDDECKQRMEMERRSKNFESQLLEFRLKIDEQSRKLQELQFTKGRLQTVCTDYNRHLEEIESKVTNASHLESQYFSQAEELKRVAGEEQHEEQH
jgi:chromosome segregation ATPase